MIDAGLAGVRGVGPLHGEARHARAPAEIGEDRAGPGRLDGEDRVREQHADGHGEGDVLRSQGAGGDGHVADRRLLPDIEALQFGGGLQGPFRWPEGLALPFVARLDAQHADGLAAGLALRIDADPRVQGAGKIEAPFMPRTHRRGRAGATEQPNVEALPAWRVRRDARARAERTDEGEQSARPVFQGLPLPLARPDSPDCADRRSPRFGSGSRSDPASRRQLLVYKRNNRNKRNNRSGCRTPGIRREWFSFPGVRGRQGRFGHQAARLPPLRPGTGSRWRRGMAAGSESIQALASS